LEDIKMKTKPVKTVVSGCVLALVALILFSLMVGAGTIPSEPIGAAQGRGHAVMEIAGPAVMSGIKVIDLDFGVTASPSSGEPNDPWSVKPGFSEITVVKEFDATSPQLSFYCAAGEHLNSVLISMLPSPIEPPYYEVILVDAVITKIKNRMVYREQYQDYAHMEEVSFKYRQITWSDIGGEVRGWDLLSNQPL
jgi:type VI secretion system Hcp family effector